MIETERLVLRRGVPADLPGYARLWGEAEDDGVPRPPPLDVEAAWGRLPRQIGHWAAFGYGLFLVEEKATGALVGEVGFAEFRRGLGAGFDGAPEAAWRVARDRRGRGYAGEAMGAAGVWLDGTLGPVRAVCMVHPRNVASLALAERLGFRAFARRPYRANGPVVLLERPAKLG